MGLETIIGTARKTKTSFTVLGSGGFIGSHFCRFLQENEIPFTRPDRGDESIFARPLGNVIYAIGLTADFAKRPFDTVEAHVGLLSRILEKGQFSSLVYLSSTRLYDGGSHGLEQQSLLLNPSDPRHIFDLSKGLGEALCLQTRDNTRVARLSSVYAEDLTGQNFLYQLVRASINGRTDIDTAPTFSRDYIDMADAVPLLLAIALEGRRRIYNVASGENVTNEDVLARLAEISGHRVVASRPPIASVSPRIDIDAIQKDFGFRPRQLKTRLAALVANAKRET